MGGYIYVATTASRPAEVKIGCTTGSPQKRMRELSIPSRQMVLLYAEEATDARMLEREVHAVLAHARVSLAVRVLCGDGGRGETGHSTSQSPD